MNKMSLCHNTQAWQVYLRSVYHSSSFYLEALPISITLVGCGGVEVRMSDFAV